MIPFPFVISLLLARVFCSSVFFFSPLSSDGGSPSSLAGLMISHSPFHRYSTQLGRVNFSRPQIASVALPFSFLFFFPPLVSGGRLGVGRLFHLVGHAGGTSPFGCCSLYWSLVVSFSYVSRMSLCLGSDFVFSFPTPFPLLMAVHLISLFVAVSFSPPFYMLSSITFRRSSVLCLFILLFCHLFSTWR